ncbi:glycoside hydrolase family 79 protein [Plenodomus tracheiphilus IPT5]|uniref:Glycoside hydrolase family 79 protein n=1 Tax=Plenodomus tracheiphilus IPT5 TaxID=1408161 RepID=A0A6A7ASC9_9PLEO|nr:glycoside hydrolase family 79 protein [Plenodomus tracheiphilus IPT5]
MLQNLKDITGSPAHIRVGGTTANHATWVPDQKRAIIQNFATPGADQPANVSLGPNYLQSFQTFPKGTLYTVGVTFDSGKVGEDGTVKESMAFYQGIGDDLFALEVGNEFDAFPVNRTLPYTIQKFVPEWLNRTSALLTRVFAKAPSKKLFQAGAFVAPGTVSNDTTFNAQAATDLGIFTTGVARTYCTHQYFGAACHPVKPTLAGALMNRTALQLAMNFHASAAALTLSNGVPYVLGETNSIACQGLAGVSDVFGAAIWAIDYALYAAAVQVSGIYWHMGTGYRYNAWQATQNGTTAPGPRPLYYGNLFVASALGGKDKQVVAIANTSSVAGYAVYAAASPEKRAQLEGIVLVNMEVYNSSASTAGVRSSVDFELPKGCGGQNTKVSVRRLTAAGAEVKDRIAWAGRTVALDGMISGKEVVEQLVGGTVNVKASEAVLISFK